MRSGTSDIIRGSLTGYVQAMHSRTLWPYLWAATTTLVGVPFAITAFLTGGRLKLVSGVLEAHGGAIGWLLRHCRIFSARGIMAITVGHIVLGRDQWCLDCSRAHEHVHVRQCERWGPFFIPAYLLASLIAVLCGRHIYQDNPFERDARRIAGSQRQYRSDPL